MKAVMANYMGLNCQADTVEPTTVQISDVPTAGPCSVDTKTSSRADIPWSLKRALLADLQSCTSGGGLFRAVSWSACSGRGPLVEVPRRGASMEGLVYRRK